MRLLLRTAVIGLLLVLTGISPSSAAPATETPDPDVLALAELYAPRVVVRQPTAVCGEGEPFQPMPVGAVLGRPDVGLQLPNGTSIPAPTAADLAAAGEGAHLNLPGNALSPGCSYAEWSRVIAQGQQPTLYARIATDPDHPDQLVLQYWFYWIFNDWNNRHEGDWEMLQITFPAATATEALTVLPTSVAFAQHEGAETSAWDDEKLLRDGTHLVVYPSQGSHAAYYDQSRWFGNSAAAGFGCDDTSVSPQVRARLWEPDIVLVPTDPAPVDPEFGWLTYEGRWGERQPSFNNGPTGPNTKTQWTNPITWQEEEGRGGAVAIPPIPGPAVDSFCNLTTRGSLLFLQLLETPLLTVLVLLAVLALVALLVRGTAWRGTTTHEYDQERQAGQILVAAVGIYLQRWRVLIALGVIFLLASLIASALAEAILDKGGSTEFIDTQGMTVPVTNVLATVVLVAVRGPIIALVVAAAIALVAQQHPAATLRQALQRAVKPPTTAVLLAGTYLLAVVLASTVFLIPVALWLTARWAACGPAAMIEGLGYRRALERSSTLTHRKRWRTIALMGLLALLVVVPGPLLGVALLGLTGAPFWLVNTIVAASFAVTLPILGIALTLQFYDLRQEEVRDRAGGLLQGENFRQRFS